MCLPSTAADDGRKTAYVRRRHASERHAAANAFLLYPTPSHTYSSFRLIDPSLRLRGVIPESRERERERSGRGREGEREPPSTCVARADASGASHFVAGSAWHTSSCGERRNMFTVILLLWTEKQETIYGFRDDRRENIRGKREGFSCCDRFCFDAGLPSPPSCVARSLECRSHPLLLMPHPLPLLQRPREVVQTAMPVINMAVCLRLGP